MTTLEAARPEPMTPQELRIRSQAVMMSLENGLKENKHFRDSLVTSFFKGESNVDKFFDGHKDPSRSHVRFTHGHFTYAVTKEIEGLHATLTVDKHEATTNGRLGSVVLKGASTQDAMVDSSVRVEDMDKVIENTQEAYEKIYELFDEIFQKPATL